MKLTLYYPGDVLPAYGGVYLRKFGQFNFYALYINGKWRVGHVDPGVAAQSVLVSSAQKVKWRGLAKEPK